MKNPFAKQVLAPSHHLLVEGLSKLLHGQSEQGTNLLKQAVESNSDEYYAYYFLGKFQADSGQATTAKRIYLDLLRRPLLPLPFKEQVETSLIDLYLKIGDLSPAHNLAMQAVKTQPNQAHSHLLLTRVLEKMENWEAAETAYTSYAKIANENPANRLAFYSVQKALALDFTLPARSELLQKALKINPKCYAVLIVRAQDYLRQGQVGLALDTWEELFTLCPQRAPWVFREMEEVLFNQNQLDQVMEIYHEFCLQEGPHTAYAHLTLARYFLKKNELHQAWDNLEKAMPQLPSLSVSLTDLTQFYKKSFKESGSKIQLTHFIHHHLSQFPFTCRVCHHQTLKPSWLCSSCGSWDSLVP